MAFSLISLLPWRGQCYITGVTGCASVVKARIPATLMRKGGEQWGYCSSGAEWRRRGPCAGGGRFLAEHGHRFEDLILLLRSFLFGMGRLAWDRGSGGRFRAGALWLGWEPGVAASDFRPLVWIFVYQSGFAHSGCKRRERTGQRYIRTPLHGTSLQALVAVRLIAFLFNLWAITCHGFFIYPQGYRHKHQNLCKSIVFEKKW